MLEKLGGRKFVLTLICVAVGTTVELYTQRGITAEFAGLLAALVAAFGAANAFNTKQYLTASEENGGKVADINPQVEVLSQEIQALSEQVQAASQTATAAGQAVSTVAEQVVQLRKLANAALKIGG